MVDEAPKIVGQLLAVMDQVGAIEKTSSNKGLKFKFRGIDAVVNAVQPALIKHAVIFSPRVLSRDVRQYKTSGGSTMQLSCVEVEYTFTSGLDGSTLVASVYGEAADTGDKSTSKAMSMALKYALFQVLCIPTEDMPPDADGESHNLGEAEELPSAPSRSKQAKADPRQMLLVECLAFAERKINELGVGAKYKAGLLCEELSGKKARDMSLEDAHDLKAALEKWQPAETQDSKGFGDDPPLCKNTEKHKALHALASEVRPHGDAHTLVHQAAEVLGYKSYEDVPESRYPDMRRELSGLWTNDFGSEPPA